MGGAYDYELLDALKRIADSAERAAVSLEKLSYYVEKDHIDPIQDILNRWQRQKGGDEGAIHAGRTGRDGGG